MCCPTPLGVARQLSSVTTSQLQEMVFTWLKRYARNVETRMAVKFARFRTASDVLLPSKDIVRLENMPEEAMRPIARTYFRSLTVTLTFIYMTQPSGTYGTKMSGRISMYKRTLTFICGIEELLRLDSRFFLATFICKTRHAFWNRLS